jgi:hypothetical protein
MTVDWGTIVQKIPEMGMVVAVIYFALEMTKQQRSAAKEIMAEWRQFLQSESTTNRQFLADLRNQQNEVIGRLAEEIKQISKQISLISLVTKRQGKGI